MQSFDLELKGLSGPAPQRFCGWTEPGSLAVPVVFLHGWLMNPDIWAPAAAGLAAAGRASYAVWQPGHGSVPGPLDGFSMESWADWLAAGLDALGVDRYVLAGHSMGGILALEFLSRYPARVAGVALVGSSTGAWPQEQAGVLVDTARMVSAGWSEDLAAGLAPFLVSEAFVARNNAWPAQWAREVHTYDLASHVALAHAFAGRRDHTSIVMQSEAALLAIHGEADLGLPIAAAEYSTSLKPDVHLERLPGCGHCAPLEMPAATADAITAWLKRSGL